MQLKMFGIRISCPDLADLDTVLGDLKGCYLENGACYTVLCRAKEISSGNVLARAYRPTEGGERVCNFHISCIESEMLAVTKFTHNDVV